MKRLAPLLIVLAMAGAAQAQPAEKLSRQQAQGKALFERTCAYCHRARGYGTEALAKRLGEGMGLLETRTDLPPDYVKGVIKQGLGNMPAYTPTDLTAAELDAIAAYLTRGNAK